MGEYEDIPKDVEKWDQEYVIKFLGSDLKIDGKYTKRIKEQEIDGWALLRLEEKTLTRKP